MSLYVHVPFCVKKCPYCGFYSTEYEISHADRYITALRKETESLQEYFNHCIFSTVYIGGGTPSVLSEQQFSALYSVITKAFHFHNRAEVTIEANPNSVTDGKLELWLNRGVNRLSLGVQSFSDAVLNSLGRLHDSSQARKAYLAARKAGFRNIGMDLIYAVPGQTHAQWAETLGEALESRPEHLACYSLSFDEGSRFRRDADAGVICAVEDEAAADMYAYAVSALTRSEYTRYEISNFARPGYACRHNMQYWKRGAYLGLGPGAWSFIKGVRSRTVADCEAYCRMLDAGKSAVEGAEIPDCDQSERESIMLLLRTAQGLDLAAFAERHGKRAWERLERNLAPLAAEGLLRRENSRLILTERGILLSNEALARLTV